MADTAITPGTQMKLDRHTLGLSLSQMAAMLGYRGHTRKQMQYNLEAGIRTIRPPQHRLMAAYLSGYRPDDWPPQSN